MKMIPIVSSKEARGEPGTLIDVNDCVRELLVPIYSEQESLCANSVQNLNSILSESDAKCITRHPVLSVVCLNSGVEWRLVQRQIFATQRNSTSVRMGKEVCHSR